jgi:hypothetical protein
MSTDTQLMIASSVLNFILLFITLKVNKKYFIYSLVIVIAYNAYAYYGYYTETSGGVTLVWMVYLIFINLFHAALSIGVFLWQYIRKKL